MQAETTEAILRDIFTEVKQQQRNEYQVNCPKCAEERNFGQPDGKFKLNVNPQKERFHCWVCGYAGQLGKLVHQYGSRDHYRKFKEESTLDSMNRWLFGEEERTFAPKIITELPKEFIPFNAETLKKPSVYQAYQYLMRERGLSPAMIRYYRLGVILEGKFSNRVIVPSYDEMGVVNFFSGRSFNGAYPKYRNCYADKNHIIFNEHFVNWDARIYLVEGPFDMFSLPNAIPMMGKFMSHTLEQRISYYRPPVTICLDPDATQEIYQLFNRLETMGIEVDYIPPHVLKKQDMAECFQHGGKTAVLNLLKQTSTNPDSLILELFERH